MKRFPWISLTLLLVAYASFGWFLSGPEFPSYTLLLAIAWVWLICNAFMSPITSFSRFVSRWFQSDTVAFLAIFMLAAFAAVVLFWLHIFLYITTIIAVEALARIDVQTAGYPNRQAFLVLVAVSLLGLTIGWNLRDHAPPLLERSGVPALVAPHTAPSRSPAASPHESNSPKSSPHEPTERHSPHEPSNTPSHERNHDSE